MNTRRATTLAVIFSTALAVSFCKKEQTLAIVADSTEVPVLNGDEDYPASTNDHLATLGKVLFYDKELSLNKNISCGSCHQQKHAFTDNLRFSPGTDNLHTSRNTPSIFARTSRLFWDGRVNTLPDLALRPVQNDVEMNVQNIPYLVQRLSSLDYYNYLFQNAFPRSTKIDSNMIRLALAEFLRNFNFANNKFHRNQKGGEPLTASEQLGKNLFFGSAKCSQCHHIVPQQNTGYGSTDEFHNIGLDSIILDKGVGAITRNKSDEGAFMMPVLLNVELTAPYMHDGRFNTLEEVVEHYNSGIKNTPGLDRTLRSNFNSNSPPIRLNLSETEKKGLVDFLKTLTDPAVLQDPKFSNPFVLRAK